MTDSPRAGGIALALGSILYVILTVFASAHAGPRGWGLHASGFLPPPIRDALLAAMVACAGWVTFAAFQPFQDPETPTRRRRQGRGFWRFVWILPYGLLLWLLRARTQLLGDGTVWLATVRTGEHRAYSEPLFAAFWHGFAALVRLTNRAPAALSMSLFSVLCGMASVPILMGIAAEIAPAGSRGLTLALLLTLGVSQLYFGYIESYPFASLFILFYLWLALRRARGADPPWIVAAALALAVAAHLSALSLVPSYLLLLALEKRRVAGRLLDLALPFVLIAGLLVALQYRPAQWAAPLHAAMSGMRQGFEGLTFHRPYGFFSYDHAADVLNAVLLVMPVPAILLLGWAASTRGRFRPLSRPLLVAAVAALPGSLLLAGLMTPVAPGQDWDLGAIFLLPAAIFAVGAPSRLAGRLPKRGGPALAGLAFLSLLSFTLVNASETAAVRRFAAIVNDPGRVSPYGRSYGNSVLELYERDRGAYEAALPYARAAVQAEPTNPRNWTNVGFELMRLNRHQEAIPYIAEGIRRGPSRWEARYNLGLCLIELGRYGEAVPPLREAVRLNPDAPVLRHNLGLALYRSGRSDSALVVWREVLARWPAYATQLRIPKTEPSE
jgi:tetratricopeptide (TPR) repeat protein